jgi:two-component system sensor histidine kinase FlrB
MNASSETNRTPDPQLADAFAIFTAAAESLQRCYQQLQAEASQLRSERESARRLIALAEMSSVLAHEIRNPLGTMELVAELLGGCTELNPRATGWVKELQAGIRSLSATVNNVLRFHTLGAPTLVLVPLSTLLRDAVDFVRPLADKAGVDISLEEDLGEIEIAGSNSELQQVIFNLAINAFQHTEAGGKFRIRAWREHRPAEQFAVVELADTGRGIKAEDLARIFEPGFTTRQSPGLGLTICRKIVHQHKGTLTVRSQPGKGTTFTMELPIA